ncbi:hypothetical protein Ahy_A10g049585 [Arachis hypogaea]|uniref:SWIM-type domain-containing protein n=1 Tax=Arachis hypogaea TaxID=3818 RepID=A0A445B7G4_ARAHY|nr:hypothetical protein Ahy_A10g049585 [Arachis hypogaea]
MDCAKEMALFNMRVHHGGVFGYENGVLKYLKGQSIVVEDIDSNRWSAFEAYEKLRQLGYLKSNISALWYKDPTKDDYESHLKLLGGDTEAIEMCTIAGRRGFVDLFVVHEVEDAEGFPEVGFLDVGGETVGGQSEEPLGGGLDLVVFEGNVENSDGARVAAEQECENKDGGVELSQEGHEADSDNVSSGENSDDPTYLPSNEEKNSVEDIHFTDSDEVYDYESGFGEDNAVPKDCNAEKGKKGLLPAFEEVIPGVDNRFCVRHLYSNFRKKFSGLELKNKMWRCAKASHWQSWEKEIKSLRGLNEGAFRHLNGIPPRFWSRSRFTFLSKCDSLVNNMSESFNAVLVEVREKPIVSMLEDIRVYMMTRWAANRERILNYPGNIMPMIRKKLEKRASLARDWRPYWSSASKYEVMCGLDKYVVYLAAGECSCQKWQMSGIPCPHAINCITFKDLNLESYVDDCYKKEAYIICYQERTQYDDVIPPLYRKPSHRPVKKRKRGAAYEDNRSQTHMSRKGEVQRCSNYGGVGHKKSGCSQPKKRVRGFKVQPKELRRMHLSWHLVRQFREGERGILHHHQPICQYLIPGKPPTRPKKREARPTTKHLNPRKLPLSPRNLPLSPTSWPSPRTRLHQLQPPPATNSPLASHL